MTCSSGSLRPTWCCAAIVTLIGKIEAFTPNTGGYIFYSIGNQTISGTTALNGPTTGVSTCGYECPNPVVIINGQASPASVCDGDQLTIGLRCYDSMVIPYPIDSYNCIKALYMQQFSSYDKKGFTIKINPVALVRSIKNQHQNKLPNGKRIR